MSVLSNSDILRLEEVYNAGGMMPLGEQVLTPENKDTWQKLIKGQYVLTKMHPDQGELHAELTDIGLKALRSQNLADAGNIDLELSVEGCYENSQHRSTPLGLREPADFWRHCQLSVWGRYAGSIEPVSLGTAELIIIRMDAAEIFCGYTLESFMSMPGMMKHEAALSSPVTCTLADSISDLTTDLELDVRSAPVNLIIVEDLHVRPEHIGRDLGAKMLRHIFVHYGQGGGLCVLDVKPYGSVTEGPDHAARNKLALKAKRKGFKSHPLDSRYLIGDIEVWWH